MQEIGPKICGGSGEKRSEWRSEKGRTGGGDSGGMTLRMQRLGPWCAPALATLLCAHFMCCNSYHDAACRQVRRLSVRISGTTSTAALAIPFALQLRGGGKRQKRRAKSTRHVLEDMARTSLRTSSVRPNKDKPMQGPVRNGLMGHMYDPLPSAAVGSSGAFCSSSSSYGRAAGDAARQRQREQEDANKPKWQSVKAPLRKRHRVIIDGSNVLKHGGGKGQIGNMVRLCV